MLEINANIRSYELTRADVISKKLFLIINNCAETTVLYVQPVTEIVLQRRLWGGKVIWKKSAIFSWTLGALGKIEEPTKPTRGLEEHKI